jgi:tetraacyldisaccharide 4'-kinase
MTLRTTARWWLFPLNPIYQLALGQREFRLRHGWESVRRLRYPVVSVGNLSTGGAGKTPFAIHLAKALTGSGFAVDVLSRGYGRQSAAASRVRPDGTAEEFGDEPLLIAREAGVPVFVAGERYEAGLLAEEATEKLDIPGEIAAERVSGAKARVDSVGLMRGLEPPPPSEPGLSAAFKVDLERDGGPERGPRVHILDDAFQHRQLYRDVDILLLNREDWHGHLLPAGNLRETLDAARRASVLVIPFDDGGLESELRAWGWQGPIWRVHRRMGVPAIDGPVMAFCGIARPHQFFDGLEASGLRLAARMTFRDHHRYTNRDLDLLQSLALSTGAVALVTTEKDRVRVGSLAPSFPFAAPLLTAGLRVEIDDESAVLDWLTTRLNAAPASPSL